MTPPVELVADVLREVKVPVRVMIRDNTDDLDLLEAQIQSFINLPLDGIIFGTLDANNHLDFAGMDRVLHHMPQSWGWTLHRAFDWAAGTVEEKLAAVKAHGRADHVLTGDAWHLEPPPGIAFIAGGGLSFENLPQYLASPCREFHFGRDARTPQETTAPVDAERVRKLADLLHEKNTSQLLTWRIKSAYSDLAPSNVHST